MLPTSVGGDVALPAFELSVNLNVELLVIETLVPAVPVLLICNMPLLTNVCV